MAGRTRNNNNSNGDRVSAGDVARIICAIADRVGNIPSQNQDQSKSEMIAKFEKLHPYKFLCGSNPYEVESWLRQIKKLLDTSDIQNEQDMVTMAVFQMEGEANHWWKMIRSTRQVKTLTWRQFKDLFMEKYFPNSLRQEMVQEFLQLKQGKMPVTQYANRFEALSKYVSAIVANEKDKVRRFEWGLDTDIRGRLIIVQLSTYAQMVDRALFVECELADSKRIQNQQSRNNNQS
ncbi:uncharacterized protein LOC114314485 [Camellia sinensis]|uniref:uncharacterized protein LOC114314485 n=1 Tax=Camellia sinensis TaxID=4442 RepID=UPI001036ED7F|nr:uncharacterized protein LOC114314485 [Camellia sinensis]